MEAIFTEEFKKEINDFIKENTKENSLKINKFFKFSIDKRLGNRVFSSIMSSENLEGNDSVLLIFKKLYEMDCFKKYKTQEEFEKSINYRIIDEDNESLEYIATIELEIK